MRRFFTLCMVCITLFTTSVYGDYRTFYGAGGSYMVARGLPFSRYTHTSALLAVPLMYAPVAAYANHRLAGFDTSNPILKIRRVTAGDEVDVYDQDGTWLLIGGDWIDEAAETMYVTTWYDQSGGGNNATQTTAASQPELKWEGATFGSELVTNGTFDTDTGWNKGAGWTISGGTANCDGTQSVTSYLETSNTPIPASDNKHYKLIYTISNYSAGSMTPTVGSNAGETRSSNGTFEDIIYHTAPGQRVKFGADVDFVGSIDNVSVKEVLTWQQYPILEFDGIDDWLDVPTVAVNSVSTYLYPETTTENIADFDGGTHTFAISSGTLAATGWTTPTLYVDGAAGTTVTAAYHTLAATTATQFSASAFDLGRISSAYGNGYMKNFFAYNEVLDAQNIFDLHTYSIAH